MQVGQTIERAQEPGEALTHRSMRSASCYRSQPSQAYTLGVASVSSVTLLYRKASPSNNSEKRDARIQLGKAGNRRTRSDAQTSSLPWILIASHATPLYQPHPLTPVDLYKCSLSIAAEIWVYVCTPEKHLLAYSVSKTYLAK